MEGGDATASNSGNGSDGSRMIKLNVKFGGRLIPVEIPMNTTIKNLKSILQPLTNVLPRGQKLISKGRVLLDEMTLESSEITRGSNIMLIGTQGLHQGEGPIKKEAPGSVKFRGVTQVTMGKKEHTQSVEENHFERWKATGVFVLIDFGLKAIPEEVLAAGPSVRILNLNHNSIQEVPDRIGCLSSIQKLNLDANNLVDGSVSWKGLASLKSLNTLSLKENRLTKLPAFLGALTSLEFLTIENNELTFIPSEIGLLTRLKALRVKNNRIQSIPASIGGCISLIEIDVSSNLLVELPETIGNLKDLKTLWLRHNGLRSIPSTLFKECKQLRVLDLHGTEITTDLLRQFEGWDDFEKRRIELHQKQLDFRVASAGKFDDGADKS